MNSNVVAIATCWTVENLPNFPVGLFLNDLGMSFRKRSDVIEILIYFDLIFEPLEYLDIL